MSELLVTPGRACLNRRENSEALDPARSMYEILRLLGDHEIGTGMPVEDTRRAAAGL